MPGPRNTLVGWTAQSHGFCRKSCMQDAAAKRNYGRASRVCWSLLLSVLAWLISPDPLFSASPMPAEFMPVAEIQPGMIGEGRTVFRGFDVENFKVEILGVDHFAMAGSHLILAKLDSPHLEQHGVVAGMSGSPVFIDGRLIGAVAYGWSFSYAPYAGITPIENMWEVWNAVDDPYLQAIHDKSARRAKEGEYTWDWEEAWMLYRNRIEGGDDPDFQGSGISGFRPAHPAFAGIEGELQPVRSPVFISSTTDRVHQWMGNFLGRYGQDLMAAGSLAGSGEGLGDTGDVPDLTHGSALGVPLLSGDLSLAGVGTVTWVDGDRLIAFGHPMMFLGGTRLPMSHAWVFGFMQSYLRSFKLSEVRESAGTIVQDRLYAIAGIMGGTPPSTQIRVRVHGAGSARKKTYHYDAIKNPDFLPVLVLTSIMESYGSSVAMDEEVTVSTQASYHLAGEEVITRDFLTSTRGNGVVEALFSIVQDLFLLMNNPFRTGDVRLIDVDVRVISGYGFNSMVNVGTDYRHYRPGEEIRIESKWQRWREDEFVRSDQIRLPENLDAGSLVIHIADSEASRMIRRAHRPGRYLLQSYEDIIEYIGLSNQPQNRIDIFIFEPTLNVGVSDSELPGLPPSVRGVVNQTVPLDQLSVPVGRLISHREIQFDLPVYGSGSLVVEINPRLGRLP